MNVAYTVLLFCACVPAAWADVNKCVGADGKVTYTDKPCAGIGRQADMDVRGMTYSSEEANAGQAVAESIRQSGESNTQSRQAAYARTEREREVNRRFDEQASKSKDHYRKLGKNFEARGANAQADIESQRQASLAEIGAQPSSSEINRRYDRLIKDSRDAYNRLGPNFAGRAVESEGITESQRRNALRGSTSAESHPRRPLPAAPPHTAVQQVIDVNSGTVMVPAAGGVVDPRDGTFHQEAAGGYVNTRTGEFEPKR